MLVSRKITMNLGDPAVDLVGENVDLDRSYTLHLSMKNTGNQVGGLVVGGPNVTVANGFPLLTGNGTAPVLELHGERLYAVIDPEGNESASPFEISVLAYGE